MKLLKRFCGVCGKELPDTTEYFVCEKCHKVIITSEDKFDYMENSRLYYQFLTISIAVVQEQYVEPRNLKLTDVHLCPP